MRKVKILLKEGNCAFSLEDFINSNNNFTGVPLDYLGLWLRFISLAGQEVDFRDIPNLFYISDDIFFKYFFYMSSRGIIEQMDSCIFVSLTEKN